MSIALGGNSTASAQWLYLPAEFDGLPATPSIGPYRRLKLSAVYGLGRHALT